MQEQSARSTQEPSRLRTDLSRYDNSWYQPGGFFKRMIWYLVNILFFLNRLSLSSRFKVYLLRLFGAKVGQGVVIKPAVNIKYPWNLQIGDHVWVGEKVWIDNLADVKVGDNCCISQGAMLLCGNHNYKRTTFDLLVRQIHLEDGVWIGAQAIVCPGVVARSHSILTVGSVAVQELEAYMLYQGNPAQKLRKRTLRS